MAAQTVTLAELPGHTTTIEVVDGRLHHRTVHTATGQLVYAASWTIYTPQ